LPWHEFKLAVAEVFRFGVLARCNLQRLFKNFLPSACTWALLLGVFLYRSLSFKQFYKVTLDTIETTAGVLLVVAAASLFGWVLTTTRVTEAAADAMLSITDNKYIILLLINGLLLVVGCFWRRLPPSAFWCRC
jgi:TRAP-type C4-dicarboxylate transport system permease large subunit